MEEKQRIKVSDDRTDMCKFVLGDLVSVVFNKYGIHHFIGKIEEISENLHCLDGIWISILPVQEYKSDETARRMIRERIRCMVPLNCVKELHSNKES